MRISKDLAASVAIKMVSKIDQQATETYQKMKKICVIAIIDSIPPDVQNAYNKHPDFIRTESAFKVFGPGIGYDIKISLDQYYPRSKKSSYGMAIIELTESQAVEFMKLWNQREDLIARRKRLEESIKNALIQLGTYKRVKENFPEACDYLPAPDQAVVSALSVNISDVREQIKVLA